MALRGDDTVAEARVDGRTLTPREQRALDDIAARLAADRRLRRTLVLDPRGERRLRVVAAAVMLTCIAVSLVVVGLLARHHPPFVAFMVLAGVIGGGLLVAWAARAPR